MRSTGTLSRDDRAIEGLPIRLVIALVVGVASLAVMLQILGRIGPVGQKEVGLDYDGGSVVTGCDGGCDVSLGAVTMTTKGGKPVEDATVLIVSGTLELEDRHSACRQRPEVPVVQPEVCPAGVPTTGGDAVSATAVGDSHTVVRTQFRQCR